MDSRYFLEFERFFDEINKDLFGGILPMPSFTIQVEKKNSIIKFFPNSGCFAIGARFAKASPTEMQEAFLHEMVHLKNHTEDVVDCTGNQYHNKKFMNTALKAGLFVANHKTYGWGVTCFKPIASPDSFTSPSAAEIARREKIFKKASFNYGDFKRIRNRVRDLIKSTAPKKQCFLKYVCKCAGPYNSIRTGRRPDGPNKPELLCLKCNSKFEYMEEK